MTRNIPYILLPLLVVACDAWPRYGNLPEDSNLIDPDQDPREFVLVDWERTTEAEIGGPDGPSPSPVDSQNVDLGLMQGVLIEGELDGVGWNDFSPRMRVTGSCTDDPENNSVLRDPGQIVYDEDGEPLTNSDSEGSEGSEEYLGDWVKDVDYYRFTVLGDEADTFKLCAQAMGPEGAGDDRIGWDLLLYELDDCDLPGPPVERVEGGVLGSSLASPYSEWAHGITPGHYAIVIAGYVGPDQDDRYPYHLGLSLVPDMGGGELCPLLPTDDEDDS
ncbi:MAG: hypothetical protein EA397_05190 [Deltaproteobacteria bacterium]|nr:MAG: hypothetical protein EA397_05190 [Deltaproteobacteria bacterium]